MNPPHVTDPLERSVAIRTPRKGVWMFPGVPAGMLADAVVAAEALGLDEVWIADEGVARDPVAVLASACGRTTRIRLAVGITSPLLRHPGSIAAALATLDELSGGRAVLGLGVGGVQSLGPFGITTDRPVAVMRDAIKTARAVFQVEHCESYEPPAHAFGPRSVPIWIGTRGPQMSRLAARQADGILVSGCTAAQHIEIVERVRATGSIEVALHQSVSSTEHRDSVLAWDDVGERLRQEAAIHRPDAIGISLVDLNHDQQADAVALVERAATVLAAI